MLSSTVKKDNRILNQKLIFGTLVEALKESSPQQENESNSSTDDKNKFKRNNRKDYENVRSERKQKAYK